MCPKIMEPYPLIALVITIVVLIILAGVAINLTLGENGIFGKTTEAKQKYEIAAAKEKIDLKIAELQAEKEGKAKLQELVDYLKEDSDIEYTVSLTEMTGSISTDITIGNASEIYVVYRVYQFKVNSKLKTEFVSIVGKMQTDELKDNTSTTKEGTIVKLPDKWKTEEGSTVYAVSVGNGVTVPIPREFYYVGGNLETGVVISDKEEDSYTKNKRDMTLHTDTSGLIGNQFVWIPCNVSEYKKTLKWNNTAYKDAQYDTTTPSEEYTQIEKYGGFYIGRYEAGLPDNIDSTSMPTTTLYNVSGIPQSKANKIPWTCIEYSKAKSNSENMYNTNYVASGLITGTEFDVILNKIVEKTDLTINDICDSSLWGNFASVSIDYIGRKISISNYQISTGYSTVETGKTGVYTDGQGEILTTAASEYTKKYNIYDLAGNAWERTIEKVTSKSGYSMIRGSAAFHKASSYTVAWRNGFGESGTGFTVGFRVVLNIK